MRAGEEGGEDLENHENGVCPFRIVTCGECEVKVRRDRLDEHDAECCCATDELGSDVQANEGEEGVGRAAPVCKMSAKTGLSSKKLSVKRVGGGFSQKKKKQE